MKEMIHQTVRRPKRSINAFLPKIAEQIFHGYRGSG